MQKIISSMMKTLRTYGMEEVIQKEFNSMKVDISKIECDYYVYLKTGKPEFHGEYMSQYSWAEETCGLLWEKKTK